MTTLRNEQDRELTLHEQQQVDDALTALGACWSINDYKGAQRIMARFLREIQSETKEQQAVYARPARLTSPVIESEEDPNQVPGGRNWHSIIGPNGMCECGLQPDGTYKKCGELLKRERESTRCDDAAVRALFQRLRTEAFAEATLQEEAEAILLRLMCRAEKAEAQLASAKADALREAADDVLHVKFAGITREKVAMWLRARVPEQEPKR